MARKKKVEEPDPFNGAGDFDPPKPSKQRKPRKATTAIPKTRKPKPVTWPTNPAVVQVINDIRSAAEGALARLHLIDMEAAAEDFEWIINLANQGLEAV